MATIYCFTSTGNSLYTANTIVDKIGGKVLSMRDVPAVCEDDVIGLVFPVFFWGLPRIVERFISKLQFTNKDAYVFAVLTSGGPVPGVLGLLKSALKANNIQLRYGKKIVSVTNYLPEYKSKDSDALRDKIVTQIHKISNVIANREDNTITTFSFLNKLINRFMPDENSDQYFSISTLCKGCATCQKVCPASNITMEAARPVYQHRCEHCLACLHNCPVRAIDWKDKTQGKERYRNVHISLDELITFNSL